MVCVALAVKGKDGRSGRVKLGLALLGSLAAVFDEVGQGSRFRREGGGGALHAETGAGGRQAESSGPPDRRNVGGGRDDWN